MAYFGDFSLSDVLHVIGQTMRIPCVVILILLMAGALWQIGDMLVELFTEWRRRQKNVDELLAELHNKGADGMSELIDASRLPKEEKIMVHKMLEASSLPKDEKTALAQKFLADEEARFEHATAIPELIAKLGPMFGLLGTLIPLGPGIVALGKGDTATLSSAIGLAFDTTIAGLLAAASASVVSNIKSRWYDEYMSSFEAVMEYVLEEVSK